MLPRRPRWPVVLRGDRVFYGWPMRWLLVLPLLMLGGILLYKGGSLFEPGHVEWTPPGGAAEPRVLQGREPCLRREPLRQALFGDLHVHTGLSMDTVIRGGRSRPEDAYRFALGESISLFDGSGRANGETRIDRPLDFAAVTDHAEWLGETSLCLRPGSAGYDTTSCQVFRGELEVPGAGLFGRIAAVVGFFGRSQAICGEDGVLCREEAQLAWAENQAAAEAYYDRSAKCSFTTFHAWEYSASPARSKVHRNVILRNEIVPELPISWIDEPEAEGLWRKLDERCNQTGSGCEALAIPHNPNVSNGQIFLSDMSGPIEAQRARAELRARMEPLLEVVQAKGESECRNGFAGVAGVDEICDLDKVRTIEGRLPPDCGEEAGAGALRGAGCQSRVDFARYALLEGVREQERLGLNPYRVGFVGGTDTHNGTPGATDERSYPGHNAGVDATLAQRIDPSESNYAPAARRTPGGLMGVWAEANERDAIFDAMKRRETFATSGTRIRPRFFGGWSLPSDFCERDDGVAEADRLGVPMGGVLPSTPGGPPTFAASALRDPGDGAQPLQRIQLIKGWVDADAVFQQRIVDLVGHSPGEASVDPATCATGGPGSQSLCAVWTDDEFDPAHAAVYYVRVLENPSCRWSAWQCLSAQADDRPEACDDPEIPWQHQERAWSSPIWFDPSLEGASD